MRFDRSFAQWTDNDDPKGLIRAELDAIFLEAIFPVATYVAGLFFLFSTLHPWLVQPPYNLWMAGLAAASGGTSAAIAIAARKGQIKVKYAYVAGFGIFGVALIDSAAHMWFLQDMDQSTNFALIFVAIGLFFLSRRYLIIAFGINFAVWLVLAGSMPDPEHEIVHFSIMNLQAAIIGVLAQTLRLRVNRRLIQLRGEATERETLLQDALSRANLYVAAERENKAKTEFLANMSHELRTPLNAILGFSEMMKQEVFGPIGNLKYRDYIDTIFEAGRHLLSLVNDILDLSRIQLDANSLMVQKVDFERVCLNCLSIVRERAQRGHVVLNFRAMNNLPCIETDERRLKQILINLLNNAVKFTPAGGMVGIDVTRSASGGVVLCVRDTGIGMNTEELRNATKPFWQAESGLDRNFEGTGLGLALVRELAKVMQAEFELHSEKGIGTVAVLTLPASVDLVPNQEDSKAA